MPGRGLASVGDDLVELLDHLGVDRLPVIGISGGGPHVLALGARHPGRISAATVVADAAPLIDAEIRLRIGINGEAQRRARAGGWRAHVVWYHSRHDANVPLQAAQRLVDRLPSVDLRVWEGGHLEPFQREEELVRDLLSRTGTGGKCPIAVGPFVAGMRAAIERAAVPDHRR